MFHLHHILLLIILIVDPIKPDLITNLPGAPRVSFKQYAGYFQVSKTHFLHYWFVESVGNPAKDPLLLWLTGGPGCSGISALLTEFGPLLANADGKTLRNNPYSWNKLANILILEAPAGVGYSYSTNGDVSTNDQQTANENYQALKEFFKAFPQYKKNDFYVTGESYGGIYVPTLVKTILDGQSKYHINIKGMVVGNGCVSVIEGFDTIIEFVYAHGMVDESTWRRAMKSCCKGSIDYCAFHTFDDDGFCTKFANDAAELQWSSGMNPYNMYASCVTSNGAMKPLQKRFLHEYYMNTGKRPHELLAVPCLNETAVTAYLNQPNVRSALFVPKNLPDWSICSDQVGMYYRRVYTDMHPQVRQALDSGLRVLIYNGDVDMACNFLMGQRFSQKIGYPETSAKKVFKVDGQVGGFHTQYGALEFETIRGAGHMVPTDKPSVAEHIMRAFLSKQLP